MRRLIKHTKDGATPARIEPGTQVDANLRGSGR